MPWGCGLPRHELSLRLAVTTTSKSCRKAQQVHVSQLASRSCLTIPARILSPLLQVWLAMLAAEVSTSSPGAAVQSVLERAVNHDSGRHCPLLWRLYLRFEAHRGRHDSVRRWDGWQGMGAG